ncbi:MAG: HAD family hydrolase [archaeon]|nr:HAD family hydrolase [archaeon]
MTIKGVFFDFYGTLIKFGDLKAAWNDWLGVFYDYLTKLGLKLSKEEFAFECSNFMEKEEPSDKNKELTIYERRIERLCIDLGVSVGVKDIQNISLNTTSAWDKHHKLDPEAIPLLEDIKKSKKGIKTALISNYDHHPVLQTLIKKLNIQKYFDVITISSELGIKKPDPAIFSPAIKITGFKPEEIIYVGDSEVDIIGAKSAGITPIFIRRKIENDFYRDDFKPEAIQSELSTSIKPDQKNKTIYDGVKKIERLSDLKKIIF